MTRIRVQFSLTGLAHMPQDGIVETDELHESYQNFAHQFLVPEKLAEHGANRNLPAPDAEVWTISFPDSDPGQSFELELSEEDDDILDLFDEIRSIVLSRDQTEEA